MLNHINAVFEKYMDSIYGFINDRDTAAILKIVKKHPELLRNGYLEGTFTHLVALENLPGLIEYAASQGIDIDVFDTDEGTPLHVAGRNGSLEAAESLLRAGADVNSGAGRRETPLQAAAAGGHVEVVELLLKHGADVNTGHSAAGARVTALSCAITESREAIADLLRRHGATDSEEEEIPLELAWEAFDDERYDDAISHFSAAISQSSDPSLFYNRGVAYDMNGDHENAVVDLSRCLELHPEDSRALYSRHTAYRNLEKWDSAVDDIKRAYELAPQDYRIVNAYAQFLAQSPDTTHRNPRLAIQIATRACELSNCDRLCLQTLADAYREAGELTKAKKLAKQLDSGGDDG